MSHRKFSTMNQLIHGFQWFRENNIVGGEKAIIEAIRRQLDNKKAV